MTGMMPFGNTYLITSYQSRNTVEFITYGYYSIPLPAMAAKIASLLYLKKLLLPGMGKTNAFAFYRTLV